jgi:hypothetical protein
MKALHLSFELPKLKRLMDDMEEMGANQTKFLHFVFTVWSPRIW